MENYGKDNFLMKLKKNIASTENLMYILDIIIPFGVLAFYLIKDKDWFPFIDLWFLPPLVIGFIFGIFVGIVVIRRRELPLKPILHFTDNSVKGKCAVVIASIWVFFGVLFLFSLLYYFIFVV